MQSPFLNSSPRILKDFSLLEPIRFVIGDVKTELETKLERDVNCG